MIRRSIIVVFVILLTLPTFGQLSNRLPPHERLIYMFEKMRDGTVWVMGEYKTTAFAIKIVEGGTWYLTAGHGIDADFPPVMQAKEDKIKGNGNDTIYKSTEVIVADNDTDLLLFKIPHKAKYIFKVKNFIKPYLGQENWIFGFRGFGGEIASGLGYVTINTGHSKLLQTSARPLPGNSGSPVVNRDGKILGVLIMNHGGDGLFIPAMIAKKFIEDSLGK